MWKELVEQLARKHEYVQLQPPAPKAQIDEIGCKLAVSVPDDLRAFLLETNGDGFFIMSVEQIIETNLMLREMDYFMPIDCLLFFGTNGCGDYVGYPICKDGLNAGNVFFWDHESDSRKWCANGLMDVIEKYYSDNPLG